MEMIPTRNAYGETLVKLGKENRDIVVLDSDLSKSTRTDMFAQAFPERFFDVGIAEQNMMTVAAGLATCGKIPFASTYAVFATERALNQVRQSIIYPKLNVKIVASHCGITVGPDGTSHQTTTDIAIMRSMPHLTVVVPADAIETEMAVRAVAEYDGPVYMRLGRTAVPIIYEKGYKYNGKALNFELGKAVTLREGKDVTIIATGIMVSKAISAASLLSKEGVDARVINVHTIKPLDEDVIVKAAKENGAIVTAEEHSIIGGLGSAVAEILVERMLVPVSRVGIKDEFGESGSPDELLQKYGLTETNIVSAAKGVIKRKTN